jgi:hypothetical protein
MKTPTRDAQRPSQCASDAGHQRISEVQGISVLRTSDRWIVVAMVRQCERTMRDLCSDISRADVNPEDTFSWTLLVTAQSIR